MKRALLLLAIVFAGTLAQAYPPSYDIADHDKAQAEARERLLPLAWVGLLPSELDISNPDPNSRADLEQMALATLKDRAVIIIFDGRNMGPVPWVVHAQYHIQDDGPLEGGAAWVMPKIVFSNPEVTKTLGRVSETQMLQHRDFDINVALLNIRNDPSALVVPPPPPPPSPDDVSNSASNEDETVVPTGWRSLVTRDNMFRLAGSVLVLAVMLWLFRAVRG